MFHFSSQNSTLRGISIKHLEYHSIFFIDFLIRYATFHAKIYCTEKKSTIVGFSAQFHLHYKILPTAFETNLA